MMRIILLSLMVATATATTKPEITATLADTVKPGVAMTSDNKLEIKYKLLAAHDDVKEFVLEFKKTSIDLTGFTATVPATEATIAGASENAHITFASNALTVQNSTDGETAFDGDKEYTITLLKAKIVADTACDADSITIKAYKTKAAAAASDKAADVTTRLTTGVCKTCEYTNKVSENAADAGCYCRPKTDITKTATTALKLCYNKTKKTTCTTTSASAEADADTYTCATVDDAESSAKPLSVTFAFLAMLFVGRALL